MTDLLEESPSLQPHLPELLAKAYRTGLVDAVAETGQDLALAKSEGPMTVEQVMYEELEGIELPGAA